jgi:hypothetical protein
VSATELQDVTALLERVLPDPTGFAERLVNQLMAQFSGALAMNDPRHAGFPGPPPGARQPYRSARTVITEPLDPSSPTGVPRAPGTTLALLAAALGACDCWGSPGCPDCGGEGSSGWAEPDPVLFRKLVGPAIARLTTRPDDEDDYSPSDHHDPKGPPQ